MRGRRMRQIISLGGELSMEPRFVYFETIAVNSRADAKNDQGVEGIEMETMRLGREGDLV
jgi:hypothetical protein